MSETRFEIKSWDEKPYFEGKDKSKLTRAVIKKTYTGDIDGEGTLEYLMAYNPDGSAHFVGIERIEGKVGTRSGSFVLSHEGTFHAGVVKSDFKVVAGFAAAGLHGLAGSGSFTTGHSMTVPIAFNYRFEN